VGVGKLVKQWREGDYAASEWVSETPLAVAGFNYGDYKKKERDDPESKYDFEAYATSEVPAYLRGHGLGSMAPSAMADNALVDASIPFASLHFGSVRCRMDESRSRSSRNSASGNPGRRWCTCP